MFTHILKLAKDLKKENYWKIILPFSLPVIYFPLLVLGTALYFNCVFS